MGYFYGVSWRVNFLDRGVAVRDKIREIMYECFPFDPDFHTCFVDKVRIEIAVKEIEKLFEYKDNTNWAGLDPVKFECFDSEPEQK
jgi:hypothetical protein